MLEAKNGIEAFDVFCAHANEIDIILLDVMMPEQDGLTTLKEIREASSLIPVILLTARGEEYDQLSGFSSGADDYITKPFSPSLLMARVEAVLRRFGKDTQKDIVAGELTVNAMTRTLYLSGKELDLTRREYDLLYYLIVNRSLTFSRHKCDLDNSIAFMQYLRLRFLNQAEFSF